MEEKWAPYSIDFVEIFINLNSRQICIIEMWHEGHAYSLHLFNADLIRQFVTKKYILYNFIVGHVTLTLDQNCTYCTVLLSVSDAGSKCTSHQ